MNETDKKLIKELLKGFKFEVRPFLRIAREVGMDESEVIEKIVQWQKEGIIRRVGIAVRPDKAGYSYGAMVVWKVPTEKVEEVGKIMASVPEISHVYERACPPGWEYNLFSMIHATSQEHLEDIVDSIRKRCGLCEYKVFKTIKEFKKTSPQYFTDEGK